MGKQPVAFGDQELEGLVVASISSVEAVNLDSDKFRNKSFPVFEK